MGDELLDRARRPAAVRTLILRAVRQALVVERELPVLVLGGDLLHVLQDPGAVALLQHPRQQDEAVLRVVLGLAGERHAEEDAAVQHELVTHRAHPLELY